MRKVIKAIFVKFLNKFYHAPKGPNKDVLTAYKRLYSYIRPYWWQTLITFLITLPIGALDAAIAYALKPYIDGIQAKQSVQNVSMVPLIIVGFTLLQGLLNYASIYFNGWLGWQVMADIRRDLFIKLQSLDVRYFDKTSSGMIIQGFFRDPESIRASVLNSTKTLLTRFFSSISLMAVLVYTSWKLSIIAIVVMLISLYPSTRVREMIKKVTENTTDALGEIITFYNDTVGGIRILYGYNYQGERLKKYDEYHDSLFDRALKTIQIRGWLTPVMHLISSVGIALIIWQGSLMVVREELTTGAFVSFIAAMLLLYNPIKNLGGNIVSAQQSLVVSGRIFGLLDKKLTVDDKPNAVELKGIQHGITFENVCFFYDYERPDRLVLRDINLSIRKGETVALVGPSGGGKTTIVNLIPRFYDVVIGHIKIDGVDIHDYTLASLRSQIAVVFQDNFLFHGTIYDNLMIGKPDATEEELHQALKKAYLLDFVNSLEKGLETHIGERGVMLSGGQRQRIAIARAFLKNAPIVIMDEATSALDNESEAIVQKAMEALMEDRTVIVIAHRLSTIRNVDRIIVIANGRVAEEGTHESLLQQDGIFAKLYRTQFDTNKAMEAQLHQMNPVDVIDVEPVAHHA